MLLRKKGTRRVKFSGHEQYWEAWWFGWTRNERGRLCAAVEFEDGRIHIEQDIYLLQFMDREYE